MTRQFGERAGRGVHLVGSVPLSSPDEVFQQLAGALGDRVDRLPDGETGPRADWIVWQYPVLSSRPEFEVCPPGPHAYRSLPRLRLRDDASPAGLRFDHLGYAAAAEASFRTFARLKRAGTIPAHVRFQVSLPTPLSPVAAFVAPEHRHLVEPAYEAALLAEVARITAAIPHDQLAIQWDANFEFAMLDGLLPAWFDDVRAGVVERLLRLARSVPADVPLGFHFCHDHERLRHDHPYDARRMVEVANALSAVMTRPLQWLHLPVPGGRLDVTFFEKLAPLQLRPETELYLGIVHLSEGVPGLQARLTAARRYLRGFGIATACGWGRHRHADLPALVHLHTAVTAPTRVTTAPVEPFAWPAGVMAVPDEPWAGEPLDPQAVSYDTVDGHSWYANLDPTVVELSELLRDGDVLVDHSGGTGLLVERLKLRSVGRRIGAVIADVSPGYLRVAAERFRTDPSVAVRLLRRDVDGRVQDLDEALGTELAARGADVIVSTNAVQFYDDIDATVAAWHRLLRPGGRLLVSSSDIRNPRARVNEWVLQETVGVLADLAEGIVRSDPAFAAHRALLDDTVRLKAHAAVRERHFPAPRPLDRYLDALRAGGFVVESVREASITTGVDDWYEYLAADSGPVLGWLGGTVEIDGRPPADADLADRRRLLRRAIDLAFGARPTFQACWTYLTCVTDRADVAGTSP